jgi:toxin ParE1/3/4
VPRFDLTEAAHADLVAVAAYTNEQWGKAQADKYLEALDARLTELARRPLLGLRRDELGDGTLSFPFQSHIIYYERTDFGIVVLRLLHKRQDPRRHIE